MVVVPLSLPRAAPKVVGIAGRQAKLPVSAAIITFNEARRIGDCLAALSGLVDQIVVLDSNSQDRTREIALSYGAEVHVADWAGYGPQKRRAEELCKHDWVLSLDADERLSPTLATEIRRAFTTGSPDADAYRLRIVDQLPHEKEPASWAFAYQRIRFYNWRKGRFLDSLVHDDVVMEEGAQVRDFEGPVAHVSLETLSAATDKFNRYTDLQAEDLRLRGRRIPRWRILTEFPVAFLKSYFLRRRFLYGLWGVIHSVTYAHMRFMRVAKAYEARFRSED